MSTNEPKPGNITVDQRIKLERCQSWDESFHVFDEESAFAVEMALATGRPLLIRGEPGSGKSQLARAAAQELNRCFIAEVVTAATEGSDLLWRFDPVARLSDAQTHAAGVTVRHPRRQVVVEGNNSIQSVADESGDSQQNGLPKKKKTPRHRKKNHFDKEKNHRTWSAEPPQPRWNV
ncbi:MAG: hypothetical protein D3924_12565 [Candidatus Electrothrix sp. AR4]|nr:hypothetical protein [Candidatus Electrothrix sp. AR4]